ncbi:hypothetical protein Taro_023917 [Colocasia esculenta]|uniref:Protein FLX-like 4 n=1 Tax=Colocasia esculenta TaxID=4460 RepID=A0A843V9S8_COLES|nr:hypothetical protein [Colocasia esculenta]
MGEADARQGLKHTRFANWTGLPHHHDAAFWTEAEEVGVDALGVDTTVVGLSGGVLLAPPWSVTAVGVGGVGIAGSGRGGLGAWLDVGECHREHRGGVRYSWEAPRSREAAVSAGKASFRHHRGPRPSTEAPPVGSSNDRCRRRQEERLALDKCLRRRWFLAAQPAGPRPAQAPIGEEDDFAVLGNRRRFNCQGHMATRGNVPAPGMMKHGPFPAFGPVHHQSLEPVPLPDLLEKKVTGQAVEMDKLARENQRLAATHVTLRQELIISQLEMQKLHSRVSDEKMESDIQFRGLCEKIAKLEADVKAGESLKRELQKTHVEVQSLVAARQELISQMQEVTEELQKAHADIKQLPKLHAELDDLRQEHQRLRGIFEREKGLNIEQVRHMHVMEKNMISVAREVEKLRADVLNSEKITQAPGPYDSDRGSANPAYPPAGQAINYAAASYGQPVGGYSNASSYANGSLGQVGAPNYATGVVAEGTAPFGGVSGSGPYDAATGGFGSYNPARGALGLYDPARGAPPSAQG